MGSIKDGRYERQKYMMLRSGLLFPMYLVEGNLDELPAGAKAAKTAATQTEIWAGACMPVHIIDFVFEIKSDMLWILDPTDTILNNKNKRLLG